MWRTVTPFVYGVATILPKDRATLAAKLVTIGKSAMVPISLKCRFVGRRLPSDDAMRCKTGDALAYIR
jgi:hypothetical protein